MNVPSHRHPPLYGEVTSDGEFARLFFQRLLPHPPGKVWAAITDPTQLRQWLMASTAVIDGREGGTTETVAGPSGIRAHGRILAWDPPRVDEHEWIADPRPEMPQGEHSVVRWELQPVEGGTLLTLTHRRLTRLTAGGFAPGWHAFLDRLERQLAGEPLPDWVERFAAMRAAYPAWEKAAGRST
jgi:uncharacterized protein YndB with AHSA1/START domain